MTCYLINGYGLDELVGRALKLLNKCLQIIIMNTFKNKDGDLWYERAKIHMSAPGSKLSRTYSDINTLFSILINAWNIFSEEFKTLNSTHKALVHELRTSRNYWAHQKTFTPDEAYSIFYNVERLLTAFQCIEESAIILKTRYQLLILMAQQVAHQFQTNENQIAKIPDLTTMQLPNFEIQIPDNLTNKTTDRVQIEQKQHGKNQIDSNSMDFDYER